VRVSATDGGIPPKSTTATAVVTVERNVYQPTFNPQRIDINILETHMLGIPIVDINATDKDTKVNTIFIYVFPKPS
jgi:hypothetical protein